MMKVRRIYYLVYDDWTECCVGYDQGSYNQADYDGDF